MSHADHPVSLTEHHQRLDREYCWWVMRYRVLPTLLVWWTTVLLGCAVMAVVF